MPDGGVSNGNNVGREAVLDRLLKTADEATRLKDRAAGVAAVSAVLEAAESSGRATGIVYTKRKTN